MSRLVRIDDLYRRDHAYLEVADQCYFLREYTAGLGRQSWRGSGTNDLISNFKKDPARSDLQLFKHRAIRHFAQELGRALALPRPDASWALVPMPPFRLRSDPSYDDRMLRLLTTLPDSENLDIRDGIEQKQDLGTSHRQTRRLRPAELLANYQVREELLLGLKPETLLLFDDLLTTGAHFKAAQALMERTFRGVRVIGIFLARTVRSS